MCHDMAYATELQYRILCDGVKNSSTFQRKLKQFVNICNRIFSINIFIFILFFRMFVSFDFNKYINIKTLFDDKMFFIYFNKLKIIIYF